MNVVTSTEASRSIALDAGRSVARMILRDSRRFVLIVLASAASGWLIAAAQPPQYRASALAAVIPRAEKLQPNELLRGMEVLERRTVVATIAALASTPAMRTQVASSGYAVAATVVPNTHLIRVVVQGRDRARTAAIANRIPEVLSAQTRAIYTYYGVRVVSPAAVPDAPFVPQPGRATAAGFMIGVFLGALAAYVTQRRSAGAGSTT